MIGMNPPERIETQRLVLRKPRLDDAPILFHAYMQDPETTRYTTWRPHRQLKETEDFILNSLTAWGSGTRFPFVIILKDEDQPFGMIDFHVRGSTVGFGYVIARSHQGNGYATEATRAVIYWAFQQPAIYR